jgi:hypothetical protein
MATRPSRTGLTSSPITTRWPRLFSIACRLRLLTQLPPAASPNFSQITSRRPPIVASLICLEQVRANKKEAFAMTECMQERFEFEGHHSKQVVAEFDGEHSRSDGGALLLREVDRRLRLQWPEVKIVVRAEADLWPLGSGYSLMECIPSPWPSLPLSQARRPHSSLDYRTQGNLPCFWQACPSAT